MRVSSINNITISNSLNKNCKNCYAQKQTFSNNYDNNEISFKKWGGSLGAAIGTFAGLGLLTVVTGGVGTAALLGSMAGCTAGGIIGEGIHEKISGKKDPGDPDWPPSGI